MNDYLASYAFHIVRAFPKSKARLDAVDAFMSYHVPGPARIQSSNCRKVLAGGPQKVTYGVVRAMHDSPITL